MKHKCLGSLIVFLLFISITLLLSLAQVKLLLKSDNLLKILDQAKIYDKIANFGEQITQSSEANDTMTKININAFTKSVDPIWIKQIATKNIPIIFDFLNNKTKSFSVTIDLTKYKETLGLNYPESAKEVIKTLPQCAPDFTPKENEVPNCLPTGVTASQVNSAITPSDFTEQVTEVPDNWQLNEQNLTIQNFKKTFTAINIGFLVSLIVTIILIAILVLLCLSYPPSILRWVGLALVLPSGAMLILDLINLIGKGLIQKQIHLSGNQTWIQIITPVLNVINDNLTRPGLILSGIIFLVGLISIIISYFFGPPPASKPAPLTQPPAPPTPTGLQPPANVVK